jgi:hypothetical protein
MAQDGIDRQASEDPTEHRELWTVEPPMAGRDVANLQRGIRDRLRPRGIGSDEVPVAEHGKHTYLTGLAAIEAQYFLGLRSDTYLKHDDEWHRCVTIGAQQVIRDPEQHRTAEQRGRAKERRAQLDRGPRYYADLLRQHEDEPSGKGADAALDYARGAIGVTESPAGSNWGGRITGWIKATGYNSPVPWCGCFTNACIMAAGVPSGAGWIGYTPYIVSRARNRVDGWSWHRDGKPGDLHLCDTPGGDPAVHVGIVEKSLGGGRYQVIDGNTSSGSGGSQANGGGVFRRVRSTSGNFRIIGFARPPY